MTFCWLVGAVAYKTAESARRPKVTTSQRRGTFIGPVGEDNVGEDGGGDLRPPGVVGMRVYMALSKADRAGRRRRRLPAAAKRAGGQSRPALEEAAIRSSRS